MLAGGSARAQVHKLARPVGRRQDWLMVTVLLDRAVLDVDARPGGDALWTAPNVFLAVSGYELKPEGACRDDVCVPLPTELVRDDAVDIAGFWRHTAHPVLRNDAADVWHLAESAIGRRTALESLHAPDFTLPDSRGVEHSLSDFRGKKVFLATWASW